MGAMGGGGGGEGGGGGGGEGGGEKFWQATPGKTWWQPQVSSIAMSMLQVYPA